MMHPFAGPPPFRLKRPTTAPTSRKWILDPRWFRHLAPADLHPYHATFDTLYREWLGREVDWERTNGKRYAVSSMEIVSAILRGARIRVPVGDPVPIIEMVVEKHPDGSEIAKVLPRWLQRTVTHEDVRRSQRSSAGQDDPDHVTSHPTLIMEIADADPQEKRYQDVRNIFIAPAKFLISPSAKLPLTGARPFTVYCHTFGDLEREDAPNWFYYGVTQRPWQERWAEHARAIRAGSQLKFHRTLRDLSARGEISFVGHEVVHVAEDLDELYGWEEDLVAAAWGDPMLMNMIPGGKAGLAYLAKHGMLGARTRVRPDERDRLFEAWAAAHPRVGLPAPWVAERWENRDWAASFVCSGHGRLTVQQVGVIRELGRAGRTPDEIRELSGARTLSQVAGVLSGATYSRVP